MWTAARAFACGAFMAYVVLAPSPAAAQFFEKLFAPFTSTDSPENWKSCAGQNGATIDQRINSCTTVIAGEAQDTRNRAGAFANRFGAIFHFPKSQRAQRREQSAEVRPAEANAVECRFVNAIGIKGLAIRAGVGSFASAA